MLRDLKFEVMPICEVGATFAFKAYLSEDELLDRIEKSRMRVFMETKEFTEYGKRCIEIDCNSEYVGTYVTEDMTLFTSRRELFVQMA